MSESLCLSDPLELNIVSKVKRALSSFLLRKYPIIYDEREDGAYGGSPAEQFSRMLVAPTRDGDAVIIAVRNGRWLWFLYSHGVITEEGIS